MTFAIRTFWIIPMMALLSAVAAQSQTTWRVPDDYPTIQAAIDASGNGIVIVLTAATYTGDGNRDVDFQGKAVTVRSESGDPESCIIDCQSTFGDRHRGFVFATGESQTSRLIGVTVTNGYAPDGDGGAVAITNASPSLSDCRFVGNIAQSKGGAIYCSDSYATITNCVFEANSADGGGGVTCTRLDGASGPQLSDCLFVGNVADFGGGFEVRNLSNPLIERCTFSGNTANGGGGGVGCDNASFTMRECTLSGNAAGGFGGAGINGSFNGGTTVRNTMIVGSTSGDAVNYWDNAFITLTCCNIFGNAGGDWTGIIAGQFPGNGNISADPEFCASAPDGELSWVLQGDSPCAESQSSCGQIGAWPTACGSVPATRKQWGDVKALYR